MKIVLDAGRTHESQIIDVRVLDNWFSLCTDGAIHVGYGIATAGGVLLNRKGEWIMGCNSLLGECSVFDIKLWGIFDGLTLIQDNQIAKVTIQTDCLEAIKTIQATSFNDSNSTLIRRIYHRLANIGVWGMQDVNKSNEAEEMFGHGFNEERMLIETIDYEETGANTKHDPLAPPPLI
ncbi:hypothetical protein Godav_003344 [Gossypium davidsonii]|uniref:RNase H type-1 domain-containing protein n=1 Tax=Gossypium davidsonii TaxID=34287 RepID=A0A7J8SJ74_GOSDV|nr:hypothetical protein [Gossypium davidsonii]